NYNDSPGGIIDLEAALRDANMSYELTATPGEAGQKEADPTSFNIPTRTIEIGQNAIDSSVNHGKTELTSTSDGSVVEHYVANNDILVIGSNLRAMRINKAIEPDAQTNSATDLADRRLQKVPTVNDRPSQDLRKVA